MKKSFITFGLFLLLTLTVQLNAQIPRTLSYQGILTDNAGKPRSDGDCQFTFCLYDTATGGAPIWTEQKTLPVKNGLFSTILGDATPFGAAVKFDKPYWLGIRVGNEAELSPRIPLTSVGYSLSAVRADTAKVSVASLADTTWKHSGANIYRMNGNVGIGIQNPQAPIDVGAGGIRIGSTANFNEITFTDQGTDPANIVHLGNAPMAFSTNNIERFRITANGNIGIGTMDPQAPLHVALGGGIRIASTANFNEITFTDAGPDAANIVHLGNAPMAFSTNNIERLRITAKGDIGIGTENPTARLHVEGRTKTQVLEITGGSDLAEPFEISHTDSLPVGSLVVIDPEQPGKLKQATEPYDKRVAGVISGAGGINPGLTLTQEGKLTGSQHVALTGKVYALATAANGAIEPGDLLTTSSIPGHAMKATDHESAFGSVIGKAMSGLKEGEGLVLVLIQPH